MKIRLLLIAIISVFSTMAWPSDAKTPSGEPMIENSRFELAAEKGQLALSEGSTISTGTVSRNFDFSGSLLKIADSRAESHPPIRLQAAPVSWQSRLLTEGLASDSRIFQLAPGPLSGSIIVAKNNAQGGLIQIPGLGNNWSAFISSSSARDELAALELLYALILRADATGSYLLTWFADDKTPMRTADMTQYRVLRTVAARRNIVARRLTSGLSIPVWQSISIIKIQSGRPESDDRVVARLEIKNRPLAAAEVIFSRAPHSGCAVLTDVDGVAACVLQDSHGDQHEHEEEAPVVATFVGQVSNDRVLPPLVNVVRD